MIILQSVRSANFKESILRRVKHALNPNNNMSDVCEVDENHITSEVNNLKQQLPKQLCIYIAGSSKFYYPQTEEICK